LPVSARRRPQKGSLPPVAEKANRVPDARGKIPLLFKEIPLDLAGLKNILSVFFILQ
jgi:hypothetical protein